MKYFHTIFHPFIAAKSKVFERVCTAEVHDDIYTLLHKPVEIGAQLILAPNVSNFVVGTVAPVGNKLDPRTVTNLLVPFTLFKLWAMYYRGGFNHYLSLTPTSATWRTDMKEIQVIELSTTDGTLQQPVQNGIYYANNVPLLIQNIHDREGIMYHEPYRSLVPFCSMSVNPYIPSMQGENFVTAYFTTTGSQTFAQANWLFSVDDRFRFAQFMGCPRFECN